MRGEITEVVCIGRSGAAEMYVGLRDICGNWSIYVVHLHSRMLFEIYARVFAEHLSEMVFVG